MKKILLACFILNAALSAPAGGLPVIDLANLAQALMQVMLASNQVFQADQLLKRLGDPSAIWNIAGASQTLSQLGQSGVAKSLPEIQIDTTGQSGQSYNGNGLYTPVQPDIALADGKTVTRPAEAYRKHEALQMTITDYNAVIADTQARRNTLRDAQRQTAEQLKAATTDAQIQKLKGILAAQQSELSTVSAERSEAAAKVEIQKAANEADKARQDQADDELRAASLQSALRDAMQFFDASTKPVMIPDAKQIAP